MENLLQALADAIRAGTAFAMPALLGYYTVRVVETLGPVLGFVGVVTIIGRTVRAGMTIYHDKSAALWIERRKAHEAWLAAYRANNFKDYTQS